MELEDYAWAIFLFTLLIIVYIIMSKNNQPRNTSGKTFWENVRAYCCMYDKGTSTLERCDRPRKSRCRMTDKGVAAGEDGMQDDCSEDNEDYDCDCDSNQ